MKPKLIRMILFLLVLCTATYATMEYAASQGVKPGQKFYGVTFQDGQKVEFTGRLTSFEPNNGQILGEITWEDLEATHSIRGYFSDGVLRFMDTDYIVKGRARLYCLNTLHFNRENKRFEGNWEEHGVGNRGEVWLKFK